jgi:ankyrin repeat protein
MDPEAAGPEFRARASDGDSSALLAAAKAGHIETCRLLMDPEAAGPEFRARANDGDSRALCSAAEGGHTEICRMLMDPVVAGPEFRARPSDEINVDLHTLLGLAAMVGSLPETEFMLLKDTSSQSS